MNAAKRYRASWAIIAMMVIYSPRSAHAQTVIVVEGWVVAIDGVGIENAIVELEGHEPTLTSRTGRFRFTDVEPGTYTIRVRALGYTASRRVLAVNENVTVTIPLEVSAVQLDTLVVIAPREIDLEGQVRDESRDLRIMDADVLTTQGEETSTDIHGHFSVDALEEVPVMVAIRAFGYLPLDTLLVPIDDSSYVFDLEVDPLVERMIDVETERLQDRMGGLRAVTMPALNRDDLLRWAGLPLSEVLQSRYPFAGGRLQCVIVDEQVMSPMMMGPVLENTFVQEVERVEFLFRGAMLRIYTREFMRRLIGGGLELTQPTYVDMSDPPFCN